MRLFSAWHMTQSYCSAAGISSTGQRRKLELRIEKISSMSEAAQAHRQLEDRTTAGKVILTP
jgi:NADPH:quinone reductase-like Zn-dependent oxidoreductase